MSKTDSWWTIIDGLAELNGITADPHGRAMLDVYREHNAAMGMVMGGCLERGVPADAIMRLLPILEKIDLEAASIQFRRYASQSTAKPH